MKNITHKTASITSLSN